MKRLRGNQDGYALLVVLLALCVLVLVLARAVPAWKTAVQREREARMIDHAREYRMAIKRYFHKNGRYPASLEVLVQKDGNGIRYLRQPWPDPLNTKGGADGSWDLIHFGQAVSAEIVDQPPAAASGGSAAGGKGGSSTGSSLEAGPSGTPPAPGALGMPVGTAAALAAGAGAGAGMGAPGAGISGPGGGPVIGVASKNTQAAVHSFNGFDTPHDWQFVYSYTMDPTLRALGGAGQTGGALPGGVPQPKPSGGPGH